MIGVVGDEKHFLLDRRVFIDPLPVHQHRAGVGLIDAGDMAQKGGFARAVGSHQAVDGPFTGVHGQLIQGFEAIKTLGQRVYFNHGRSLPG